MTVILCPTRGGKSSIPNQEWAIRLAQEQEATLIFLYVSDVRFLDNLSSPLLVDVAHELDELGEFLLAMARDRAEQAGVETEILVRQGVFRDALSTIIQDKKVDAVVIGSSTQGTGVTTEDYLTLLAGTILERGAIMYLVDAGQLIRRFPASD